MNEIFKTIGSPRTLGQEIVKTIEENILNKRLLPGQKLPTEKELCELFGVSRTALREALQMLSAKGLVSIKKGSGIYVNDFSILDANQNTDLYLALNFDKDYALHLVHIRQTMEPENARLAAANRTDEHLALINQNLLEYSDKNIGSERHAILDLEFHKKIAEATDNPLISLMMNPLFNLMPKIKALIVDKVKHNIIQNPLHYHSRIFECIKNRDESGAFAAMKEHLRIAETDTLMLIKALEKEANPGL